jgi:Protein of unknown function (DUF3105)
VPLARIARIALAVVAGVGVAVLAVVVLGSRDKSTVQQVAGPGRVHPDQGSRHLQPGTPHAGFQYESDPPTSGPHAVTPVKRDDRELSIDETLTALEAGDVVIVYRDPSLRGALRALQSDLTGPFAAAVAAAGQAIVLARKRAGTGAPITAVAWRHSLNTSKPGDPRLREFVEFWLGRGAPQG